MTTDPLLQKYERTLALASRIVAYPHTAVTANDKHRAIALINILSDDDEMVEYLYSQLTTEEFKALESIKQEVYSHGQEISYQL